MNQNNKLAAWQNLLHKPVEVVEEKPVKVAPKVTKITEALQPVEPVVEIEPVVVAEELPVEPIVEPVVEDVVEPVVETKPKIKKTKE